MRTISYHALVAGGATDRCVKMEVVLMRHANRTPSRELNEAIWKSIKGHNYKVPAPLHKKIIGSEPGGMGGK
jgi:hypothetical protein